ncbi:MAG: hypothetical protein CL677_08645 [Bdellovibrionaceae bacterium]|nr:hypothetical protein [Pseudobdellovibrionaceae bacterium]|tara:strand:- start:3571 stop:4767 length:1197 start_codon:yes stop_codon:yes gene_type:complete
MFKRLFKYGALTLLLASCSPPKSKNKAVKTQFVRGNPMALLADSTPNRKIEIRQNDMPHLNQFEMAHITFYSEASDDRYSGLAMTSIEDGQEPTEYDLTKIKVTPFIAKLTGSQITYSPETNNYAFVFQSKEASSSPVFNLTQLQFKKNSGLPEITLAVTPIHMSWVEDQSAFSILFSIKARIERNGHLTWHKGIQETTLVHAFWTKHSPEEEPAGYTEDKNYKYILGPGVKTRWPVGSEIQLNFCTQRPYTFTGAEKWNETLEGKVKITSEVVTEYPPFSDLNTRCVYVVENYILENPKKQRRLLAETVLAMNRRSQKIIDGDIFYYRAEVEAFGWDFYDYRIKGQLDETHTHELGHFLGLHHQFDDDTESIMSYDPHIEDKLYDYDIKAILANYSL